MRPVNRYAVGLGLAALAAVVWAVGLTILQPLTEPIGPWPEQFAGNNTYWARDLRFLAVVAVVLGLVLAGGGDRRWTDPAVLLGAGWVAADLLLDRADLAGTAATVVLVTAGWLVTGLLVWFLVRRHGRPGRPVHWTHCRALGMAAAVATTCALVAGGLESPTGREPELTPATVTAALLLLAASIGCALAAAPARDRARTWGAVALAVAGAVGLAAGRLLPPGERVVVLLVGGAVLLTGTTLLSWDWPAGRPHWRRHALVAVGALLGLPGAGWVVAMATIALPVAQTFTAAAGSIAVGVAGTDILYSLVGLLTGLVLGLLLAWPNALGYRPGPADPAAPAGPDGRALPRPGHP
ncbi:hypothetical protein [Micromonospora sp. NPDC050200]|uniref:hypothetical protein n=1 Tax=Micromonospora sp. NPDC050200 TaxID=3155664 RepID=UPI0033CA2D84